eukprot:TRINITY_DN37690_c0_g1_i4.p1 TRINITY_DN37690_c0_g1~~TRINITY_DN37690_c0_g1_i4.p1  ORF type:complete len:411 (-),score=90.90 TRINITY_DN37690_c0_g1_i4:187-1419(-)
MRRQPWPVSLSALSALQTSRQRLDVVDGGKAVARLSKAAQAWKACLDVARLLTLNDLRLNVIVGSCVYSAAGKGSAWEAAFNLVDAILSSAIAMDVLSANAVAGLSTQGHRKGSWSLCARSLRQMLDGQLERSAVTFGIVSQACAAASRWEGVQRLLQQIRWAALTLSVVSCSIAVSTYAACDWWLRAVNVFRHMEGCRSRLDATAYNAALDAFTKGQRWQSSAALLKTMSLAQQDADDFSFNACLGACADAAIWRQGVRTLDAMQRHLRDASVDAVTSSTLTDALHKGGAWEAAASWLFSCRQRSCEANILTFNAVARAFEEAEQWSSASHLLIDAGTEAVAPDGLTLNAIVEACLSVARWQAVLGVFHTVTTLPATSTSALASPSLYSGVARACEMGSCPLRRILSWY